MKYSKEIREQCAELLRNKTSYLEIKKLLNISLGTIRNIAKENNLIAINSMSKETLLKINNEYKEGKSLTELASVYNFSRTTISDKLKEIGVEIRTPGFQAQKVKHNPFLQNSIERDYWVGMIATDGCVTKDRKRIQLVNCSDNYILYDYIKFINEDLKIYNSFSKDKQKFWVEFISESAYNTLFSFGITENKSLTLEMNNTFEFTPAFILGVLDGDGSVVRKSSNSRPILKMCSASILFINQLEDYLKKLGCNPHIYSRKTNIMFELSLKVDDSFLLGNLIFNLPINSIKRKKENFLEFYR